MKNYRVFVVNPGSTSTKVALFEGEQTLFEANVSHDAAELAKFVQVKDQLPYRIQTIEQALAEEGTVLEHIDACVGRGGGLLPMAGGTYKGTPLLLEHSVSGANGVQHPANRAFVPLIKGNLYLYIRDVISLHTVQHFVDQFLRAELKPVGFFASSPYRLAKLRMLP